MMREFKLTTITIPLIDNTATSSPYISSLAKNDASVLQELFTSCKNSCGYNMPYCFVSGNMLVRIWEEKKFVAIHAALRSYPKFILVIFIMVIGMAIFKRCTNILQTAL